MKFNRMTFYSHFLCFSLAVHGTGYSGKEGFLTIIFDLILKNIILTIKYKA